MSEHRPGLEDPLDERVALGWQALSPAADAAARVRARVLGGEGVRGLEGAGDARAPRSASGWRALQASGGVGLGAGSALLALGIAVGYLLRIDVVAPRDAGVATIALAASEAPPVLADPELVARNEHGSTAAPDGGLRDSAPNVAREPPRDAPGARLATASRARRPPPPRARASEGDELRVLERAERAIRARHPELALALLGELAQAQPVSSFFEERSALELMASCQRSAPDSSARGAAFARRYPSSVYAERVAAECTPLTNAGAADMDRSEGVFHVKP
jgi:hypothetical protein